MGEKIPDESFGDVLQYLLSKKTFVFLSLGCATHNLGAYGVGNFFAPFLARTHEMPVAQIGLWMGLSAGIGGMLGVFLGGYLADKFSKTDIRWYLWIAMIAEFILIFPHIGMIFSSNTTFVLGSYFVAACVGAFYLGPCLAVTHNLVDAHKRALASAILFLVLNLIGLGMGPLLIGMLSDYLSADFGSNSLRYTFCLTFLTGAIALVLFYFAAKHYPGDLEEK